jgi:uncharacterized protein (DUF924 family)
MIRAMQAQEIVDFWRAAGPERWFRKDEAFDAEFRARFLPAHEAASAGALDAWVESATGALALLLLLDQFPRNAFRGTARVYATDAKAREIARDALQRGWDVRVDASLQPFFYLPFMHSEAPADHDLSVQLNGRLGGESARFAEHHRGIIRRFGRFPHRNAILGRESTPEELAFLAEGGFGG